MPRRQPERLTNYAKFLHTCLLGFLFLLQFPCRSASFSQAESKIERLIPSEYHKTPQTQQNVKITKTVYGFKYKFSSPTNDWYEWTWKYKRYETNELIKKFGVPKKIFEPYPLTKKSDELRNKIIGPPPKKWSTC